MLVFFYSPINDYFCSLCLWLFLGLLPVICHTQQVVVTLYVSVDVKMRWGWTGCRWRQQWSLRDWRKLKLLKRWSQLPGRDTGWSLYAARLCTLSWPTWVMLTRCISSLSSISSSCSVTPSTPVRRTRIFSADCRSCWTPRLLTSTETLHGMLMTSLTTVLILRVMFSHLRLSGRTSVFGQRSFAVPRSTCSWWVTTYAGKPSAISQPTRPTQPFILSGSINK